MRLLLRLLERFRPLFEEGGRFAVLKPVYDATDSFFFGPDAETAFGPHVRDPLDVKRFMSMVIVALIPCVGFALYSFGLRVLVLIVVSYAAGGIVEMFFAVVRKEEINEGFLVTGLIYPLILPPGLPLWMAGVGIAFGVLVGKELFGGTGRNLFNPALVGRCFLALAYPAAMSGNWIKPGSGAVGRFFQYVDSGTTDAVVSATPLILAKQGQFASLSGLITGHVPGCVGETSALAVIVGGIFLVLVGVASWRTVVSMLGTFVVAGTVLHAAYPQAFAPPVWSLFAGGLLFGAFFMATDPVSSPTTDSGKWGYGALIGLATLLIRNLTGYVEGVMFAILLGNICAPLLDEAAVHFRLRRLAHEGV
ncbi:MAG: RnfABCDGE type electron transport complex subunit D [Kiritimatiellaeota bacterium]|nr:RnfABCDGE type electron transport complex subunit D [Kiritimatiellota bacterium]